MTTAVAPPALSRIVDAHLWEMGIWAATLKHCGGDRKVAEDAFLWAIERELPDVLLMAWAGAAGWLGFDRLAFG